MSSLEASGSREPVGSICERRNQPSMPQEPVPRFDARRWKECNFLLEGALQEVATLKTTTSHVRARDAIVAALLSMTATAVRAQDRVKPSVLILTTGGTIASRVGASMQDGSSLINAVPQLEEHAAIRAEEVTRVGSSQITPAHWLTLATRIGSAFREDRALRGVVVTHGTDTLEDTAFFLNLTVRDSRPVVITGSMRAANEISADGPGNLINGVRVAIAEESVGKGVLVVLNESISSARDVWKTDNRRVETFRSPELGFLGFVDPDGVVFYKSPVRPHTTRSEFDIAGRASLPEVALLTDYPGFDGALMEGLVSLRPSGVVVAGFAGGRLSAGGRKAVELAASAGIPVVIASHVPGGRIVGDPVGDLPAAVARDLSPNKARILLMLALTRTRDLKTIQRMLDTY
jgi:L-asparaginase